jgi:8-oxo-dGTP pyrophosphatase MutT (NUDIX family)
MELERLEHSKRTGLRPRVFHVIPVAYAIIKAKSARKKRDLYLFELNKDWQMYNLVGGKQATCDDGSFDVTLRREIEEELGVDRRLVKLTCLTEKPLDGYSLSGHQGVLSHYPCMLYLAHFENHFDVGPKNRWFSLTELEQLRRDDTPGLMVNPVYLDFLMTKLPGGLAGLPYSFPTAIDRVSLTRRTADFLLRHSAWFLGGLALLAALITLIASLLQRAK